CSFDSADGGWDSVEIRSLLRATSFKSRISVSDSAWYAFLRYERCKVTSLLASCSERYFSKPQDKAEKNIMHSKSVSAATIMGFPPNDRTLNLMRTFLAR